MNTSGQIPSAPKFQFKPNWKILLFTLLLLPLLLSLGVWQLQRAEEKKTIQESWQAQQALPPVPFAEIKDSAEVEFRRVSLRGRFDGEHYWLLENRILDGKLGYEIVMPFITTEDELVIVNRGWLPAGAYRSDLPQVPTAADVVSISGSLAQPSDNRFIAEQPEPPQQWPAKILQVDLATLGAHLNALGYEREPYRRVLRIDGEAPGAFTAHWQPINMSPATHKGYAVQWFTMAAALLILSMFANSNLAEALFKSRSS